MDAVAQFYVYFCICRLKLINSLTMDLSKASLSKFKVNSLTGLLKISFNMKQEDHRLLTQNQSQVEKTGLNWQDQVSYSNGNSFRSKIDLKSTLRFPLEVRLHANHSFERALKSI